MYSVPTDLSFGGAKERFANNVAAIRAIKHIGAHLEGPYNQVILDRIPTAEEQIVLGRYTGFGTKAVLDCAYSYGLNEHDRTLGWGYWWREPLNSLLTPEEKVALKGSSPNAHYTDPDIYRAIWSALSNTGMGASDKPMRILEPSAGIGYAIGTAPEWARRASWSTVELDTMTAMILKALYPDADVRATGFEMCGLPTGVNRDGTDNTFDLVISNVPFGDYGVHDPMMPAMLTKRIHDYFAMGKWLEYAHAGTIGVFITSMYAMDKQHQSVRKYCDSRAELIAAVRMPETAFKKCAGTDVVTDILVMRKRPVQRSAVYDMWVDTALIEYPTQETYDGKIEARINQYYHANPSHILGVVTRGHMYYRNGAPSWKALPEDTHGTLSQQVERTLIAALPADLVVQRYSPAEMHTPSPAVSSAWIPANAMQQCLMEIYRTGKALLLAQQNDEEYESLLAEMNTLHDSFVAEYGSMRCGKRKAGRRKSSIIPLNEIRETPHFHFLSALENEDGQKMPIFSRRIVQGDAAHTGTPTVSDAYIQGLNSIGRVDIAWIAERANVSIDQVMVELTGIIYHTPSDGWIPSTEYLSGDVVSKLDEARLLAERDQFYQANVEALTKVQPEPLESSQIFVRAGSLWVPGDIVVAFIRHLFGKDDPNSYDDSYAWRKVEAQYFESMGEWVLENMPRVSGPQVKQWSTERMDAIDLVMCALNSKTPEIHDKTPDGKVVKNVEQSTLAQAKVGDINRAFESWVWTDSARAKRLTDIYNREFNCFRQPEFDGSYLTFPGLNEDIQPRWYQNSAVCQIAQVRPHAADQVCVTHTVGFGKTLTAILAAIKRIQLGVSKKALIVVKKPIKSTWIHQLRWAYPGMSDQIMFADSDDFGANRQHFMATIATGDYKITVITFEQLKRLSMRPETTRAQIQEEVDEIENCLVHATESAGQVESQKRIEQTLKRLKKKLQDQEAACKKDSDLGVTFEDLGVDLLIADEAHVWKNDYIVTKMTGIKGLNTSGGSDRAYDARLKSHWMIANGGVWIELTGTPVSNSIAETYTIQRRLQWKRLKQKKMAHFDAWASVFTEPVMSMERGADGAWEAKTRLKFHNIPELQAMLGMSWHRVDPSAVVSPDGDPSKCIVRPSMFGDSIQIVSIAGTDELREHTRTLADRMQAIRNGGVKPDVDNALLVTTHGREASYLNGDPVNGWMPERPTKIGTPDSDGLVQKVLRHYHETADSLGVQVVFCDKFTPRGSRQPLESYAREEAIFAHEGLYVVMRKRLVDAGIPDDEIAYIHEPKTDKQMETLEAQLNAGVKRILIGSTDKAGEGKNIQERLIALHHFDCPWKPAQLEQRIGRIIRHGNTFRSVYVYAYVVVDSYDQVLWQFIKVKASFIAQLSTGRIVQRNGDDIGSIQVTAEMALAIAAGDERIAQRFALEADLSMLYSQYKEHSRMIDRANCDARSLPHEIERYNRDILAYTEAVELSNKYPALAEWSMDVLPDTASKQTIHTTDAKLAASVISEFAGIASTGWKKSEALGRMDCFVGRYRGFDVKVRMSFIGPQLLLCHNGVELDGRVMKSANAMVSELNAIVDMAVLRKRQYEQYLREASNRLAESIELSKKQWSGMRKAARLYAEYKALCEALSSKQEFTCRAFDVAVDSIDEIEEVSVIEIVPEVVKQVIVGQPVVVTEVVKPKAKRIMLML